MSSDANERRPPRFAVIGSGPAGFYAVEALLKQREGCEVDLYDRLPTPFGLVRYGVAPDHPKIKSVTKVYEKIAARPGFRFIGNVEVGKDVSVAALSRHYDQILIASGAQTDRRLGIPGEDLVGSHPATSFVAWYNGHPDFADETFDLSAESAVVVGVGNVAMDVARMLCRTEAELRATDVADHALEALVASDIKRVTVIGRRGPAQAAFTNPEAAELGELEGAVASVRAIDMQLDPASQALADGDRTTERKLKILRELVDREPAADRKFLELRFLESPTELVDDGSGHVGAVTLMRNRLVETPGRNVLKAEATGEETTLEASLVFRSVGYRGVPIPGVPFRDDWGTVPNDTGAVLDAPDGEQVRGLYVAGWIKRGPSGVIGTNKADAVETVSKMLSDFDAGLDLSPPEPAAAAVDQTLAESGVQLVDFQAWKRIDRVELDRGEAQGRPRVKLVRRDELLDAARE